MTWFNAACLALMLSLSSAGRPLAQAPDNSVSSTTVQPAETPTTGQSSTLPSTPPKAQFFGGTVTALDGAHITVSRSLPGKSPEHHTFLINLKTKMSKAVKVKSRVTVRYRRLPEGDVALEIQLRPLMHFPRAS
jgi:hypothetical protein